MQINSTIYLLPKKGLPSDDGTTLFFLDKNKEADRPDIPDPITAISKITSQINFIIYNLILLRLF